MTTYTKHLSEPWFSLIKIGAKKCEGRLNKGDFLHMKKGDYILFENSDFGFPRTFTCRITSIHNYNTIAEYLETETLPKCLPGINTLEEGIMVYYKYYTPQDEQKYNIKALRLQKLV